MRTIDRKRLLSFCATHTVVQGQSGRLLVKVGETNRGDDIYKNLSEFEEIYTPLPEGRNDLISRKELQADLQEICDKYCKFHQENKDYCAVFCLAKLMKIRLEEAQAVDFDALEEVVMSEREKGGEEK